MSRFFRKQLQKNRGFGSTPLKAVQTQLSGGVTGNEETVGFMQQIGRARAGDIRVRSAALSIIKSLGSQDYWDEAYAIGAWVQKNVRYVRDPDGIEQLTDPVTLLDQIQKGNGAQGDCDDMSLLIASLLLSIGHQPLYRCVRFRGETSGPFEHIYVVVNEENHGDAAPSLLALDAILKRKPIGTEVPYSSYSDYPA